MYELTKENYTAFIKEINTRVNGEVYVTIYNLITKENRIPITSYNLMSQKSWAIIKDNMELDNTIFIDDRWYTIIDDAIYEQYKNPDEDININISTNTVEYVDRLLNTSIYSITKLQTLPNHIAINLLSPVEDTMADIGFIPSDIVK